MPNRLQGKRIAIFAEDYFEDSELIEPLNFLKNEGALVTLVGSGRKSAFFGKKGANITVDRNINEIHVSDFDALIIPGGFAPDKMRQSLPMVQMVADADDHGKLIAAICHGPQLLISAEILSERMVTGFWTLAVDLKNAGAHYVDEAVVVDGNLITSRTPADIPQFNEAIVSSLLTTEVGNRQPMVAGA